jgi:hypothetical protein
MPQEETPWKQTPALLRAAFVIALLVFVAMVAVVIWAAATHAFQF